MRVSVEHEVGAVLGDRRRQPVAAEQQVDAFGLAFDRSLDRRVVEQHDPQVAVHELLEALRDRLRLARRLCIVLAQQRLAEVGESRAREAADEPFRADDAEDEARDLARAP